MKTKKIYTYFTVLFLICSSVAYNLAAECFGGTCPIAQGPSHLSCNRERLDFGCNDDSDCCPGRVCSVFNKCERR